MTELHLDFETTSRIDLDSRGLDNYAKDRSTRVLLTAYAFGDRAPKLWQPHLSPEVPADLWDALNDPFCIVHAWNAAFEHAIINHVLKILKPIEEFRDPMCNARYLSLPGSLGGVGEALGLNESQAKIKDGKRLIKLFCSPEDDGGEDTLFGTSEPTFRNWATDPKDWKLFGEYCLQDVVAERAIEKKLKKFPLPDSEWETWFLSEHINERGIPVSIPLVSGARFIVNKEMERLVTQLKEITKVDNPASTQQMLEWLSTQGYPFSSVGKAFVKRALNGECDLTEDAKLALEIRSQTAKSSVKKYVAIADTTSDDGRLRYAYQFMGAARTGRFCLAEGTRVTVRTSGGVVLEKPIQDVLTNDEVWDGDSWVSHGGVVFSGDKEVISWDGLTATPEHEVWVSPKKKMSLAEARSDLKTLWRGKPMYEIYRLTSPSGKSYIGLTNMGSADRWRKHILRAFNEKRNHPLYNAIRKYGEDSFVVEVIDFALDKPMAQQLERYYIAAHDPEKLYNLSPGGEADGETGGRIFWERMNADPEAKAAYCQKLSDTQKARGPEAHAHLGPAGAVWRAAHPREAYYASFRAVRMSPTYKMTKKEDERPLIERLRWKHNRPRAISLMKQNWWDNAAPERRQEIAGHVSKGRKKRWESLPEEDKEAERQHLKELSEHMDRSVQGPAASRGLKKFWEDLRKDPLRYEAYIASRVTTLKDTIQKKKKLGLNQKQKWEKKK